MYLGTVKKHCCVSVTWEWALCSYRGSGSSSVESGVLQPCFLQKPRLDKPNTGSNTDASVLLHFTLKDSKYRKWWHDFPIIPKLSPKDDHSNPKYVHIVHIHCLTSWSPPNGVSGPSVSEIIRQIPSWLSLLLSQQKLLSSCAGEAQPF